MSFSKTKFKTEIYAWIILNGLIAGFFGLAIKTLHKEVSFFGYLVISGFFIFSILLAGFVSTKIYKSPKDKFIKVFLSYFSAMLIFLSLFGALTTLYTAEYAPRLADYLNLPIFGFTFGAVFWVPLFLIYTMYFKFKYKNL